MVGITMKFFIGHTSTQLWGEENQWMLLIFGILIQEQVGLENDYYGCWN
jgi:hypothetical protein